MRISLCLMALLFAACGGPVESFMSGPTQLASVTALPPIEDTEERCQNAVDDDRDGKSDCADLKCKGFAFCVVRVDLRADVNRDGVVDLDGMADDLDEDTWNASHGAVFLANIDDDLRSCPSSAASDVQLAACNDAADDIVNGDDDLLDMATLKIAPWAAAPATTTAKLTSEPSGHVRMFKLVQGNWVLLDDASGAVSVDELKAGLELRLEGKDIVRDTAVWDGYVNLKLEVVSGDQTLSDTVRMRVAPVMLFHHMTAPETSYVTRVPRDPTSTAFVTALRGAINLSPEKAPLVEISDNDIWAEDFFETGYMTMPAANGQQHVIRAAYRSAGIERNGNFPLRAAGQIVFKQFRGKDTAGLQAFTLSQQQDSSSLNSYGNTETIPPFSNGGVNYPLGRLLRGSIPSFAPDPVLSKVMESQLVQPHVYLDTSWLTVGHIDETISFLKAPTPRGWVLLINDPTLAKQMLQDQVMAGNGAVQMHVGKDWYNYNTGQPYPAAISITQVLANTDVMGRSATAAANIAGQLEALKRETGLTDAEIIRVPFLHYTEYATSIAYQPGFVNGFVIGESDFVAPNPFGPQINGVDIFKKDFEDKLTAIGYHVRWVDDWDLYHVNMGEVHCGTNAARKIPAAKWWEGGR